jgi:hypothetical protein
VSFLFMNRQSRSVIWTDKRLSVAARRGSLVTRRASGKDEESLLGDEERNGVDSSGASVGMTPSSLPPGCW